MAMVSMVVGGTAATSARFVAKVNTGPVRIAYSADSGMASPSFSGSTAVDASGVAKVTITGLTANTQYYWQVEDNSVIDTGTTGQFRTHPTAGTATNFTFAAASCAGQGTGDYITSNVSNHPVFDTIRTLSPRFFIHAGDLHYRDIATDTDSLFRTAYDDVLSASRQHQLYRTIPWMYVWDDHDFGGDNSDSTATAAPAAQTVYRERVPHYDLNDADAIYQSFSYGRVLFVLSDVRSDRSPNSDPEGSSKTMLGASQKTWMETLLTTPGFDADFLVWVMPSEWLGTGSDTWASFTTERTEMVTMFGDLDWLDRMCIISGDQHALAIATESANDYGGFPVFHFGSLDSTPTSKQTQYDLGQLPGRNQYGTVQVHDTGSQIVVTGIGYTGSTPYQWYTSGVGTSRRRGPNPVVIAL